MKRRPEVFAWIEEELRPRPADSTELFYDLMDSQGMYQLPIIHTAFDPGNRYHWADRGAMFDFLLSTRGEGNRLLDFGPGDGWPSLIVAPFAGEVIGVDGSQRRVEVCAENARRLGIKKARFMYSKTGDRLPFTANTFDGIMAASSVEQSPDPRETLREFHRVLKPGGRLRVQYEALTRYRDRQEQALDLLPTGHRASRLVLYDRRIDEEKVRHYGLDLAMSEREVKKLLSTRGGPVAFPMVTVPFLNGIRSSITGALVCDLVHPSGRTFVRWLGEAGFSSIQPTHSGIAFARRLFDNLYDNERPKTLEAIDRYLRPMVGIVIELAAPIETDPLITAVK